MKKKQTVLELKDKPFGYEYVHFQEDNPMCREDVDKLLNGPIAASRFALEEHLKKPLIIAEKE